MGRTGTRRTKENYNSILRAFLHGGRGPQVVNLIRWGNQPVHIISDFNLISARFYYSWVELRSRVALSARACNPFSRGQILPCKRFKVG